MIAIDSNVLVYAHREESEEHLAAQEAINRAAASPDGWGFPIFVVAEFWSAVTYPAIPGGPSEPNDALEFLGSLVEAEAAVWTPPSHFHDLLLQTAIDLDVGGRRIYDLQIALTAREAGAVELWTTDVRMIRISGLDVVDPLAPHRA